MKYGILIAICCWANTALAQSDEAWSKLANAIRDVLVKDDTYDQSFSYEADSPCLLTFTVLDTDEGEEVMYQVNAADLNEHKIRFDNQSKAIVVEAETRGGKDLVRVFEDGEVDGFKDQFEFYADGIENAREIVNAFKEIVTSCNASGREVTVNGQADPSFDEALRFLRAEIGTVEVGSEEYQQSFASDTEQPTLFTYTWEDPAEGETRKYTANTADFNEQSVSFNTKSGDVWITLETRGGRDLIQTYEDGESDDFESEMQIMATDIEQARVLEKALKALIANSDSKTETFIPGTAEPSLDVTARYLSEQVGEVTQGDDTYEQMFTYDAATQQLTYEVIDVGDGDKNTFQVNPADLNVNTITFDTRGSEVDVVLETQGERDLIQVKENDQVDGYEKEFSMYAPSIGAARHWVDALKRLVLLTRADQKDRFTALGNDPSQAETLQFLEEYVHRVQAGEDSYQQTFTPGSDNPCLVSYTVFDEDEGEEETYEWNMADINARPITFDTKREDILVILSTTGGRELIKVVEDGEVDGYEEEVELRANDIEEARALVSAFQHLTGLCE